MASLSTNNQAASLWDIAFSLVIRIFGTVFKNNSYCYDSRFFDTLKQVELTYVIFFLFLVYRINNNRILAKKK